MPSSSTELPERCRAARRNRPTSSGGNVTRGAVKPRCEMNSERLDAATTPTTMQSKLQRLFNDAMILTVISQAIFMLRCVSAAEESFPVTLTLESVSATTAIIKWTAAHASVSASSPRLLVRRLVQFDGDSAGGAEDASVRVVALDSADSDGHYHLDELIDGQMYSAQLVVDQPYYAAANISNVLYFTTPDGGGTVQFVNFRMHPVELGVVVLILAAWAGAVAAFLHKWRRLRIVPPRQLRYKHATPKNLDAVQVVSKPNESVIYKSYTGKLSTTMEARRSRLERMQTLPNIKLISPTLSSRRSVLDSTPEIPSDDNATSFTQQQQPRRPGKTMAFVKRMSEGRFFLADRSPCGPMTSSIFRHSPLPATSTSTGSDGDRLQQQHADLQVTHQPVGVDVQRQQLKDAENNVSDGDEDVFSSPAATVVQTPTDGKDGRLDRGGNLLLPGEQSSAADDGETTPLGPTIDC